MALYSAAFLGTALVGGPLIGAIAGMTGVSTAFLVGGVAGTVAAGLGGFQTMSTPERSTGASNSLVADERE